MDIQPPTPPTPKDRSSDVVALTFPAVMLAGVVLWCVAYPADRAWLIWAIVVALPPGMGVAAWILRHPVQVADFFERAFERHSAPTRAEVSLRRRAAIRPSRNPAGPPPRLSEDPRYDPAFFTGMAGRESPTPQGITTAGSSGGSPPSRRRFGRHPPPSPISSARLMLYGKCAGARRQVLEGDATRTTSSDDVTGVVCRSAK